MVCAIIIKKLWGVLFVSEAIWVSFGTNSILVIDSSYETVHNIQTFISLNTVDKFVQVYVMFES